ncbi:MULTISPECIES: hypothetical protein [Spirulina sp. CCY15215]|uniref:hypothetical protein n=1 Tax=Spirulina sp. CCY15215 TaxID=2767591 RepID=UPI00194F5BD0|nr:hypothetical protein [Spirulina major]
MTILIANIGTSDLAVKLSEEQGNFFIPIGFDRNEPNTKAAESELDATELQMWRDRWKLVSEKLYSLWQVKTFRSYTERLLQEYKAQPELWHNRIRPGRILGVIEEAIKKSASDVYIFVTDQPEFIEGEKNQGYNSDTIHLFAILKLWIEREFQDHLNVQKIVISQSISAIDQDGLFGEYYNFFKTLDANEMILISVKGGTPQMQTALRIQAITSGIANQIYLEPQLSIKNLLAGKASECNKVSYWRYQRVQKYQTVKKLLKRWDFDGANVILKEWDGILKSLERSKITGIADSYYRLELALYASEMAVAYFNLDAVAAANCADYALRMTPPKDYRGIMIDREKNPFRVCRSYEPALNLYTRCRIYWQLGQAANFLFCFGSFYEEILHYLFVKLDGDRYFDEDRKPRWSLQSWRVTQQDRQLMNLFTDREQELKKKVNANFNPDWPYHRLDGRFSKRNFAEALVLYRRPDKQEIWQRIIDSLNRLDYWFDKRNAVTHGAKGISKERLDEILTEDRKQYIPEAADPLQADPNEACWGSEILDEMGKIYRNVEIILDRTPCPFIDRNTPEYNQAPYYIYSEAKDWVIETLDRDR